MDAFRLEIPNSMAPIVVSVPHCGTVFPEELKDQFDPDLVNAPDDTDWFVDQLYDFTATMGMPMISAVYNRWVIDLNRDPEGKPLYSDGRIITGLCPTTTFLGQALYRDRRHEVDEVDIATRREKYYKPYHEQLRELLGETKSRFGKVLLWDCHSIREYVATIQKERFPDLILGSADERSASPDLIATAMKSLGSGSYGFSHNHPFRGGYITRHYGRPDLNEHALQLEMCKVVYMDDAELKYDKARAERIREVLKRTLSELAERLIK